MKEVNELWLQIDSKKTLSCIDRQCKSFNTNIAKVQAQKGLTEFTAYEFIQSLFSDSISIFLGMYFYVFPYTWGARWLLFFDLDFFAARCAWASPSRLALHTCGSGFALAARAMHLQLGLCPRSLRYVLTTIK
jgi:hypothetical protein